MKRDDVLLILRAFAAEPKYAEFWKIDLPLRNLFSRCLNLLELKGSKSHEIESDMHATLCLNRADDLIKSTHFHQVTLCHRTIFEACSLLKAFSICSPVLWPTKTVLIHVSFFVILYPIVDLLYKGFLCSVFWGGFPPGGFRAGCSQSIRYRTARLWL
jgi:hypothetical protein